MDRLCKPLTPRGLCMDRLCKPLITRDEDSYPNSTIQEVKVQGVYNYTHLLRVNSFLEETGIHTSRRLLCGDLVGGGGGGGGAL